MTRGEGIKGHHGSSHDVNLLLPQMEAAVAERAALVKMMEKLQGEARLMDERVSIHGLRMKTRCDIILTACLYFFFHA